jgi:type I restriction enzyme S subunit
MKINKLKLNDIISVFVRGVSFNDTQSSSYKTGNNAPILRATNIVGNGFDFNNLVYVPKELIKEKQKLRNEDIVLITSSGSKALVGRTAFVENNSEHAIGAFLSIVRTNNKGVPKFLYYLLNSSLFRKHLDGLVGGTSINNFKKSYFEDFDFEVPTKLIQQKIVKILDSIEAEIKKQVEIIDRTKELKKSLMIKLFREGVRKERLKETEIGKMPMSWEVVLMGDVSEINPRSSNNLKDEDYVGFITMADVSTGGFIKRIQKRLYGEVKKGFTKFQSGDYLFAKITPCMENGKGGLYQNDTFNYCFGSTEFHIIRALEKVLPEFIGYLLSIEKFRTTAAENMSGACGQKRVPKDFLVEYKFGLPSVEEQKEIVSILKKIDEKMESSQKQKELYEELFNITLNKLMVREIDIEKVNI